MHLKKRLKIKQTTTQMTKEEFLSKIEQEHIPSDWYSLDGTPAPVMLKGNSLYYGKYGVTTFQADINYAYIFAKIQEYKKEQEFLASGQEIKVKGISVSFEHFLKEYLGNHKYLLTETSFHGEKDSSLLKNGWTYSHYDQYMGYWCYQKEVNDEIFTDIQIAIERKTSDLDRQLFGLIDSVHSSYVRYPIPPLLKDEIFEYISQTKTMKIGDNNKLWDKIIAYFTIEKIGTDELKRLTLLKDSYTNTLNYEIARQKCLGIYSEEQLIKVYRNMNMETIFSKSIDMNSRPYIVKNQILEDAKKRLKEECSL